MTSGLDLETLARRLATIACATNDSTAGIRLMDVVVELLELAGLPPADLMGSATASGRHSAKPTEGAGFA